MTAEIENKKKWFYTTLGSIAFFLFNISILTCLKVLAKKESEGQRVGRTSLVGVRFFISSVSEVEEDSMERKTSLLTSSFTLEDDNE